ncbi:hypothetical protein AAG906_004653 [Vitis piasezkii]
MTKPQQKREKGQEREKTKKREEFKRKWTTDEDNILKNLSWKSMAEHHLPGRATNAIKNRWNSHLKKRNETVSDLRRKVLYAEELLFDDEASELSVRRYDPEPLMAEFASSIPNVDPNETLIDHFLSEAEIDALMSSSIPEHTS